jgi:hypothetical protein
MSGRLNYDVWLAISSHLPVQSILNLSYVRQLSHVFTLLKASDQSWISLRSQCCNYLYDAMNTRSVWNLALGDILDVIPSPSLRDAMPLMSSRELKERATQMARVDGVFDKDIIHPTRVKQHPLGFAEVRAEVAPGGDWIVTVHEDYAGSLCLYRGESLGQTALATARRPDDSCLREGILGYDSLFLSYSEGKHLAVVSEPFWYAIAQLPCLISAIHKIATVLDATSFVYITLTYVTHQSSSCQDSRDLSGIVTSHLARVF